MKVKELLKKYGVEATATIDKEAKVDSWYVDKSNASNGKYLNIFLIKDGEPIFYWCNLNETDFLTLSDFSDALSCCNSEYTMIEKHLSKKIEKMMIIARLTNDYRT